MHFQAPYLCDDRFLHRREFLAQTAWNAESAFLYPGSRIVRSAFGSF